MTKVKWLKNLKHTVEKELAVFNSINILLELLIEITSVRKECAPR